jgi:hypothetical protein
MARLFRKILIIKYAEFCRRWAILALALNSQIRISQMTDKIDQNDS